MKQTIDTGLDKALSKRVIDKAMDAYKERFAEYTPRFDWTGPDAGDFSFNAKGIKLGGTIRVFDRKLDVEMEVPFLFKVFQGRAMKVIEDQLEVWIAKAKKGEI